MNFERIFIIAAAPEVVLDTKAGSSIWDQQLFTHFFTN